MDLEISGLEYSDLILTLSPLACIRFELDCELMGCICGRGDRTSICSFYIFFSSYDTELNFIQCVISVTICAVIKTIGDTKELSAFLL